MCFLRWSDRYTSKCPLTRVRIVKHFKVVGQVRIDVPTDQGAYCQAIINKQDYSAYNSHTSTFLHFLNGSKDNDDICTDDVTPRLPSRDTQTHAHCIQ